MGNPLSALLEGVSDVLDVANDPTDVTGQRAERKGRGERAKVVAWLRKQPEGATFTAQALANLIEQGAHL